MKLFSANKLAKSEKRSSSLSYKGIERERERERGGVIGVCKLQAAACVDLEQRQRERSVYRCEKWVRKLTIGLKFRCLSVNRLTLTFKINWLKTHVALAVVVVVVVVVLARHHLWICIYLFSHAANERRAGSMQVEQVNFLRLLFFLFFYRGIGNTPHVAGACKRFKTFISCSGQHYLISVAPTRIAEL